MGLDAIVFCNCVEKKRLRVPHPYPKLLYILPNGSPEIRSRDRRKIEAHDEWMELPPCAHDGMQADGEYLTNIGGAGRIRELLGAIESSTGRGFPTLIGEVFYSGSHSGDHLSSREVVTLAKELRGVTKDRLRSVHATRAEVKWVLQTTSSLKRICRTAIKLQKPIAF
jgi:hypothetical protein